MKEENPQNTPNAQVLKWVSNLAYPFNLAQKLVITGFKQADFLYINVCVASLPCYLFEGEKDHFEGHEVWRGRQRSLHLQVKNMSASLL